MSEEKLTALAKEIIGLLTTPAGHEVVESEFRGDWLEAVKHRLLAALREVERETVAQLEEAKRERDNFDAAFCNATLLIAELRVDLVEAKRKADDVEKVASGLREKLAGMGR